MSTDKLITPAELTAIRDEYEQLSALNAELVNPRLTSALKLVETLLADADGWAESWEEDVAFNREEPADQPMPPVPDEVREITARIVGEGDR